jgi:hypothetical protein
MSGNTNYNKYYHAGYNPAKERDMFSSTNETNGFSAIGRDELEKVNGGDLAFGIWTGIIVGTIAIIAHTSSSGSK